MWLSFSINCIPGIEFSWTITYDGMNLGETNFLNIRGNYLIKVSTYWKAKWNSSGSDIQGKTQWPLWMWFQTRSCTAKNLNRPSCVTLGYYQEFSKQCLLVKLSRTLWVPLSSLWLTSLSFSCPTPVLLKIEQYQRKGGNFNPAGPYGACQGQTSAPYPLL